MAGEVAAAPAAAPAPAGSTGGVGQAAALAPGASAAAEATGATKVPGTSGDDAMYEVVIDGQTERLSLAQLKRHASKVGFADKLIKQSKDALKATRERDAKEAERRAKLKDDDDEFEAHLREIGRDPDEYAQTRLEKRLREKEMSPEQKALAEREAENAKLKKDIEGRDATERNRIIQTEAAQLEREMSDGLFKAAQAVGLATDSDSFDAIYSTTKEWFDAGLKWGPGAAERIAELAKGKVDSSFQSLQKEVLAGLKGAKLAARLGPDVVKEILRHSAAEYRGKRGSVPVERTSAPAAKPAEEYMSERDFERLQRSKRGQ